MIDFEYHAPTSLEQVFELLDRYGDDARVIAGGTSLVIQMKQRLTQPSHVIGLKGVDSLNFIESTPEGIILLILSFISLKVSLISTPHIHLTSRK